MRSVEVKVLRDYDNGNFIIKEGQIIEIGFHISGNPTYDGLEIDNIWDDDEFDSYFGEVEE